MGAGADEGVKRVRIVGGTWDVEVMWRGRRSVGGRVGEGDDSGVC